MNYLVAFLSLLFFTPSFSQSKKIEIKGTLNLGEPVEMVYLKYRTQTSRINDSVAPKKGRFYFKTKLPEPTLATISVRFKKNNGKSLRQNESMNLFLSEGVIVFEAKDSLHLAKSYGVDQDDFLSFSQLIQPFNSKRKSLSDQYKSLKESGDRAAMREVSLESDEIQKEKLGVIYQFLLDNPKSVIGLYALKMFAGDRIDLKKVDPVFNDLSTVLKESPSGVKFREQMEIVRNTSVGAYAMDFTQNDTLGNPVTLSSFRGKYVLLDFWASWCYPCRQENPAVVEAYHKYKDKNFTVLSVSLDAPGKKQSWLNAINKDNLTWTHVSDLNYFQNAVAKQYGVDAIPYCFLIDPSGKIIAKNLRGEQLLKTLAEIIK